jgi:Bacterial Ig domain/IPT/TIG domain/FlgD Ig-like domain
MRRSSQITFSQRIAKHFNWSALLFWASLLPNTLLTHPALAQTYTSDPVTVGYSDFNYGTEVYQDPTAEKPESKLWWNDGLWWGCLWDSVASTYRIHRFDLPNQSWVNVGPDIDDRANTLSDALWDGQHLYIASHVRVSTVGPARLYRYSYDAATKSYSLDAGFPVDINNARSETLTLAKDSNGKLWVTWEAGTKIMVNRTIGDDWTWGVPFQLPAQGSPVKTDDISAIVASSGNKIGIMWSNQNDLKMYFAVHQDNKDDLAWDAREKAAEDSILGAIADDHINLKVTSDNGGTIYAVTKTSLSNPNDPLILFLKRNSGGVWTRETVWTHSEGHTRPIVLIDNDNKKAYVFASSTKNGPTSIYVKSTSLSNPQFPPGMGTVFMQSVTDVDINNPSSTKQNLNNTTGLLVVASDPVTRTYLHNYMPIVKNQPPVAVNDAATTAENTPVAIDVTTNDSDTDGTIDVTTVAIVAPAANGATAVNTTTGVITYSPNAGYFGVDAFTYTVKDDKGALSNAATVTINVAASDPTTQTFLPIADAQVKSSSPTMNYGAQGDMRLRNGDPAYNSYLKFEVTEITGAVLSAKLRLYVIDGSVDGGSVYLVSNDYLDTTTPWEEIGVTWSNAPVISGTALASVGATAANSWVEVDLTAALAGNGTYSFGLSTSSSNSAIYSTKEGVHAPELVVTVGNDTPVPPTITSFSPASGSAYTPVTITGSHFLGVLGVAFNGTAAAFVISSDTQIDVTVPDGASTGPISVTNAVGITYSAEDFTVIPLPTSVTVNPLDDAQVKSSNPTTNYGSDNSIRLRAGNPAYNSYLKFQVPPLAGQVQSAMLRLYVTDDSPDGGSVYLVSNNYLNTSTPWDEDNLTWNNAPAIIPPSGTLLGAIGFANANTWVEFDVTSTITGNGTYSFGLISGSTNSVIYSSKEGTNPPELVVTTDAAGPNPVNPLGIAKPVSLPEQFSLSENYPNPFNIQTMIQYTLPVEAKVQLVIYNLVGQKVRTLVDEYQPAGYKQVHWDGYDQYGHEAGTGVYLIRLEAGQQRFVRRITLLK